MKKSQLFIFRKKKRLVFQTSLSVNRIRLINGKNRITKKKKLVKRKINSNVKKDVNE